MCVSLWNLVPDDLNFEFNPVRDTSEKERADLIQQSSAAIISVFQSALISQKTALKELRQSGATYGMWSNITDEDIENADDQAESRFDEMGGGLIPPDSGQRGEAGEQAVSADGADEPMDNEESGTGWTA